jgi:glutamyl-tRNA reductase
MLLIDLAVPRDIEKQVSELDDAFLYTVDDLQSIVNKNLEHRQQAATEARDIITQYAAEFGGWMESLNSVDLLRRYRAGAASIAEQQKERALAAIAAGKSADQVIQELTQRLTNTLIHTPTLAIQDAGKRKDISALAAYQKLINDTPQE